MFCTQCGSVCEILIEDGRERNRCTNCNKIHYTNPFPCVSVIIANDNNEIILVKRAPDAIYPGKWCLPCGYIEYDEHYIQAAKREAFEETGAQIEPTGIINVVSNELSHGLHSLVIVLAAKYLSGKLTPQDDAVGIKWHHPNQELPPLAFDSDAYIINRFTKAMQDSHSLTLLPLEGYFFQNKMDR